MHRLLLLLVFPSLFHALVSNKNDGVIDLRKYLNDETGEDDDTSRIFVVVGGGVAPTALSHLLDMCRTGELGDGWDASFICRDAITTFAQE